MYGQLKSTVKCLECGNISITFDPFLTLALPIAKSLVLEVIYVPYNLFYLPKKVISEEEDSDPDFRETDSEKYKMVEHYVFKIDTSKY
jgi:ubiquitin carboxyl-terminal hydrolase 4/11/15